MARWPCHTTWKLGYGSGRQDAALYVRQGCLTLRGGSVKERPAGRRPANKEPAGSLKPRNPAGSTVKAPSPEQSLIPNSALRQRQQFHLIVAPGRAGGGVSPGCGLAAGGDVGPEVPGRAVIVSLGPHPIGSAVDGGPVNLDGPTRVRDGRDCRPGGRGHTRRDISIAVNDAWQITIVNKLNLTQLRRRQARVARSEAQLRAAQRVILNVSV